MFPKLFQVFKLVNMYLLDNYDKICTKGRFASDGPSVCLSQKQKADILYHRVCILIHEIFQHNIC